MTRQDTSAPGPKLPLILGLVAVAFFFFLFFGAPRIIAWANADKEVTTETEVEIIPDLPATVQFGATTPDQPAPPPERVYTRLSVRELGTVASEGPEIRRNMMGWSSQTGAIYANGGPDTIEGSLMHQYGVGNLNILRQDDVDQQAANIIACARQLAQIDRRADNVAENEDRNDRAQHPANPRTVVDCTEGVHFTAVMGDGTAVFVGRINKEIARQGLGQEYFVEIVGSAGFSRGEDKFMAPPNVASDPQQARGLMTAAYLLDGDWNIVLKWLGDNGILNNPDVTTYDPDRMNWYPVETYLEAAQVYNLEVCEDRRHVDTGEMVEVCVGAVATWTPGDVQIMPQHGGRGGLVTIASTEPDQYGMQMPNAVIGIRRWMSTRKSTVAGMLAATLHAGNILKGSDEELRRAMDLSAVVWDEYDGEYWYRYYQIQEELDATTGEMVSLGGSYVNNWADVEHLFGLTEDGTNVFAMTYTHFGNVAVSQYPEQFSEFQPADEVFNTEYLVAARELLDARGLLGSGVQHVPATIVYDAPRENTRVVSDRAYNIEFELGSSTLVPSAEAELRELLTSVSIASGLRVEIHGHTDSQGPSERNMEISEQRAFAVKRWLVNNAPTVFPEGRIRVEAHGESVPLVENSTSENRARNRRVQIILRANE